MKRRTGMPHVTGGREKNDRVRMLIAGLVKKQRAFFNTDVTRSLDFRIRQLKRLAQLLRQREPELLEAIFADLQKSRYDAIVGELSLIHRELGLAIRMLPRWCARRRARTNLVNFPARSYLLAEPFGVTYIAGAWNYPFQLSLLPLVSALAAGNTAVVKPSELAPHCSKVMADLINDHFPEEYIRVVEGGAAVAGIILQQKFDKIFFTGGSAIGKIVYEAAASHLTPATLELGGKNPAIVLRDCNLRVTAKRIVWGKFFNAGQTCVAPDYVLVHSSIERALLAEIRQLLERHYDTESRGENYAAIVNRGHFERLRSLITPGKVYYGGTWNAKARFMSPTVLHNVTLEDRVMKEEIFGPILPVLRYESLQDAMHAVRRFDRPLSLYVFGKRSAATELLFRDLSFGGGSLNDSVMYFVNHHLPYGGVGGSGIGGYHGLEGFRTFSHDKAILEKGTWLEPWVLKTPPYKEWKLKLMRALLEKV